MYRPQTYSHRQQQLSPDFFSICRKHVYAGEIGVILTLESCLIASATVSKNKSPRLWVQTDTDRRGCWENTCGCGNAAQPCVNLYSRCLKSHLQRIFFNLQIYNVQENTAKTQALNLICDASSFIMQHFRSEHIWVKSQLRLDLKWTFSLADLITSKQARTFSDQITQSIFRDAYGHVTFTL